MSSPPSAGLMKPKPRCSRHVMQVPVSLPSGAAAAGAGASLASAGAAARSPERDLERDRLRERERERSAIVFINEKGFFTGGGLKVCVGWDQKSDN